MEFSPLVVCGPLFPWYVQAALVVTLACPLVALVMLRWQERASNDSTIALLLLLLPLTLSGGVTWLVFGDLLGQIVYIGRPMSAIVAAGIADTQGPLALALAASSAVCLALMIKFKGRHGGSGSGLGSPRSMSELALTPIAVFTACLAVGGLVFALRFEAWAFPEVEWARAVSWALAVLGISVWCLTNVALLQAFRQPEAERRSFPAVSRRLLALYLVALLLGFGLVTSFIAHFRSLALVGSLWSGS